ncbi:MAG: ABC transporter ATP-binding protein [Acidimicrobiia bacterium]|nr:ABC transporter ATP-binding protein [Acidimicrobiia bacterium]
MSSDGDREIGGIVTCTGLRRVYGTDRSVRGSAGQVVALDGVDLEVDRGEFLAVLGASGCGKTTLLRLVAGFERPDEGAILLEGALVAAADVFVPPERRRVGIVVQDHALFPHLTVAGNVGFGLPGHRGDAARTTRINEVLELVGLEDLGGRYPSDLSGGQQQRVAIARALAPRPRVLLLDEPFANLDAALRSRLRLEVRDILKAAGATVVLVTHDQEEALSLADRIAVMDRGRVLQVGEPQEVYRHPVNPFVARFVGEANLVEAQSDGRVLRSAMGTIAVAGPVPSPGPAVAAVRPEAVTLSPDPDGQGRVVTATYFGHDQVVEVSLADLTLRARTGNQRRFMVGDRVRVDVTAGVTAFPGPVPPGLEALPAGLEDQPAGPEAPPSGPEMLPPGTTGPEALL